MDHIPTIRTTYLYVRKEDFIGSHTNICMRILRLLATFLIHTLSSLPHSTSPPLHLPTNTTLISSNQTNGFRNCRLGSPAALLPILPTTPPTLPICVESRDRYSGRAEVRI